MLLKDHKFGKLGDNNVLYSGRSFILELGLFCFSHSRKFKMQK